MDTCVCVIIGIIVIIAIAFLLYRCCGCGASRRVFGGGDDPPDDGDKDKNSGKKKLTISEQIALRKAKKAAREAALTEEEKRQREEEKRRKEEKERRQKEMEEKRQKWAQERKEGKEERIREEEEKERRERGEPVLSTTRLRVPGITNGVVNNTLTRTDGRPYGTAATLARREAELPVDDTPTFPSFEVPISRLNAEPVNDTFTSTDSTTSSPPPISRSYAAPMPLKNGIARLDATQAQVPISSETVRSNAETLKDMFDQLDQKTEALQQFVEENSLSPQKGNPDEFILPVPSSSTGQAIYARLPPDPDEYWPPMTRRQRDPYYTPLDEQRRLRTFYPMVTKENIDLMYGPWRKDNEWTPPPDAYEHPWRILYAMPVSERQSRSRHIDERAFYWREYVIAHLIVYDPVVCDIVREIVRLPSDVSVFADDFTRTLIDRGLWTTKLDDAMYDFYNCDTHFLERRLSNFDERQRKRSVLKPMNIFLSNPDSPGALAQRYIRTLRERSNTGVIEPTTAYGRVAYFLYRLMRCTSRDIFRILDEFLRGLGLDEKYRPRIGVYKKLVRVILSMTAAFENYEVVMDMLAFRVRNPLGESEQVFTLLAEKYYLGTPIGENRTHFFNTPVFMWLRQHSVHSSQYVAAAPGDGGSGNGGSNVGIEEEKKIDEELDKEDAIKDENDT